MRGGNPIFDSAKDGFLRNMGRRLRAAEGSMDRGLHWSRSILAYLTRPAANCLLGAALALLARCRSASIACTLPHASPSVHTYHGRSWPSSLWLSERVLQFGKRFLLRSQTNAGTSLRHELGQVRDLCGQVRADCWCALARHIRRPPRVPPPKTFCNAASQTGWWSVSRASSEILRQDDAALGTSILHGGDEARLHAILPHRARFPPA